MGYDVFDPEMATVNMKDDEEMRLFCAGNVGMQAIDIFLEAQVWQIL